MPDPESSIHLGEWIRVDMVRPDPTGPIVGYRAVARKRAIGPRHVALFDDFVYSQWNSAAPNGPAAWSWASVGAGAAIAASGTGVDGTSGAVGVADLSTGTTSTGATVLYNDGRLALGAGGVFDFSARVMLPTLATAAEDYFVALGFHDDLVSTTDAPTDAAYWRYNRSLHGDFWAAVTRKGGAEKLTVTAVPVVAGQWTTLRVWAATPSRIHFSANGADTVSHTTQLPTGAELLGQVVKIAKTAGTGNRSLLADWTKFEWRGGDR